MIGSSIVSVAKTECYSYPDVKNLFRPGINYPEYQFEEIASEDNGVYEAVREALRLMCLDLEHYGTPEWNPLGEFISPGMNILIKPNLVMDYNKNEEGGTDCLYTHPSVVAPIIDYVLIALEKSGKIVIGDAPIQECNFEKLLEESGYLQLVAYYHKKGIEVDIVDFRELKSTVKNGVLHSEINSSTHGTVIDLGAQSEFAYIEEKTLERMRVTNYDPSILKQHHSKGKHEYFISDYVLDADVIINMPKPKTHRKAGVTISMKNLVGTNVRKEFLPHHTMGALCSGGDEYDKRGIVQYLRSCLADKRNIYAANRCYRRARLCLHGIHVCTAILFLQRKKYKEGSWYGNHTISRTISDLNKIVYYADKSGELKTQPTRNVFIVADMIVSGESEGPINPSPKLVGIIAMGTNPVCFDEAICTLMGFDIKKIPSLNVVRTIKSSFRLSCDDQVPIIRSNDNRYNNKSVDMLSRADLLDFTPTEGWKGHIEKT